VDAPTEVDLAVAQLHETLHQAPECFGLSRSRWWLDGIRQAVPWLASVSLPGVWQLLERFDLVYKRGRRYVHSPDPDYLLKRARVRWAWQQVQHDPVRFVLLYQDELTYYRCPTVGCDYALAGSDAPRAVQGTGYNTSRRIAGCLDAYTGRLICWQRSAFDHQTFLRYLQAVETRYPDAECIYIALDNWPVHFQPDVLTALQQSKISLVFLPTYAPWLNPIEKVWRKLKQEILHLHRYSSRWKDLQERVEAWLIQYDRPAPDLLHYVGLSPS
jgi:DDE superfamily endonuclease